MSFAPLIASKLGIRNTQVETVLSLFEEGATIPFIARYRKDSTGNLDEVQIQQIQDEQKLIQVFTERKTFIEQTIVEQGKMTDTLQVKINAAATILELEDIYLPYKVKRKTKAVIAREHGLTPLADFLIAQSAVSPETEATKYFNDKITTIEEALQGARDIIAELVNENAPIRAKLRKFFEDQANLQSKVLTDKETAAIKYKDYFDFSEPIHKIPSHRMLAILRGFLEGYLRISIAPLEENALYIIEEAYINGMSASSGQLQKAIKDAYRRLLQPSLETECRTALKQKSDEDAINVFAENLRQLLLSAPLGSKRILAIDPGYRTGCKVVCLDENGELLKTELIFVHETNRHDDSEYKIKELVKQFGMEVFAIGDGTAGRETEQFIKQMNLGLPIFLVNEDGASVYSASEIAREEFPDYDITVRGSVSIGRRLMDPLAELVKIDPKSIGVGQYQHDVNQFRLKEKLDQTVVSCVNAVGVNLNTASKQLLSYVSGISESVADNIVKHRKEWGKFSARTELLKVPRLGAKSYEQCAGFLRIPTSSHPLDASSVHPEAYEVVEKMAADLNTNVSALMGNEKLLYSLETKNYVSDKIGILALNDIIKELKKPGMDPRSELEQFEYANIYKIEEVKIGLVLPGMVTNLTRFGAFVDIGVKQDGLVHISEIANKYISDPSEVLKLGQKVQVKVLEIDLLRKRIALSIKQTESNKPVSARHTETNHLSHMNVNDALQALKKKFGK